MKKNRVEPGSLGDLAMVMSPYLIMGAIVVLCLAVDFFRWLFGF